MPNSTVPGGADLRNTTQTPGNGTGLAISVAGVTAGYHTHHALDEVSFEVHTGSLAGLLGPNGSGKSTLIKLMIGLLKPWTGQIRVLGQAPGEARGQVGYVPQAEHVDWNYPVSVREVVAMGLYRPSWFTGRFGRGNQSGIHEALELVGMAPLAGRQIRELSGGQQRRVLLARALVKQPRILLLDEPMAGLDVSAEEDLNAMLRGLADSGRTVVVATHDIAGALQSYDEAVLVNRRIVASGPVATTLTDHNLHRTFGRQLLILDSAHTHHALDSHGGHEVQP